MPSNGRTVAERIRRRSIHAETNPRSQRGKSRRAITGVGPVTTRASHRDRMGHKSLKEALRENTELFQGVFNQAAVAMALTGPDRKIVQANRKICDFLGFELEDLLGTTLRAAMHPDFVAQVDEQIRKLVDGEVESTTTENLYVRKDGTTVWGEWTCSLIRDERGATKHFISVIQNIDDRQKAELALRHSNERLEEAQRIAHVGSWVMDPEENVEWWSDELYRIFDWEPGSVVLNAYEFLDYVHPDDLARVEEIERRADQDYAPYSVEYRIIRPDGTERFVHESGEADFDAHGNPKWRGIVQDITDRKRVDDELRTREQELSQAQRIGGIGHWRLDLKKSEFTYWSDELYRIFGVDKDNFVPTLDRFLAAVHEDDLQASIDSRKAAFAEKRPYNFEYRIVRPNGEVRVISGEARPEFDENGEPGMIFGITQDVTEARQRESELRQAQKMEVVGQLTGGVAHDFNNLLGVIIGNLELAQELTDPETEIGRLLESVVGAADRGAALTQRLLAFSRKQPLRPQLVIAHELAENTLELLKRTLGEAVEIEIATADDHWTCIVDPAQLESAILNLAVNARDAMPDGGKLTIETSNIQIDDVYAAAHVEVDPGEYVVVAISDSGSGIPPEIRERVFEPFFTTKDVGAGSGLGLSMVYGFIKQSGGHITVYSEVGEGTTIRLYLPRHLGGGQDSPERMETSEVATARNEVILVVEDDDDLRLLVVQILKSLEYDVLEAGTAHDALEVFEQAARMDLLLTDVVLPGGMSGPRLAQVIQDRNPELPVLYMSGYTEDAIIHQGRLEQGVHLLQKPFRKKDIAQAVRKALDNPMA